MPTLVFSYAHEDEGLRNELEKHLSPLKRMGRIDTWHDRCILPGQNFETEIDQNFSAADIVLLLISPDFVASDYCYQIEMAQALERHGRGETVVIPVILRPCAWQQLPFGKLVASPLDGKPIIQFPNVDEGFVQVVESVSRVLDNLDNGSMQQSAALTGLPSFVQSAAEVPAISAPRSSNLGIRKTFSDRDKDLARREGIQYLANFFDNSLAELKRRYPDLDTDFHLRDADSFQCTIYQNGTAICRCGIWRSSQGMGLGDICFSESGLTGNSFNESLIVEDDGHILGYKPLMGGFSLGGEADRLMTAEGMAEYLWDRFIRPLK